MATYYSSYSNGYRLRLELTNSNPSVVNNASKVDYSGYLEFTNMSFDGGVTKGYFNLGGTRIWTAPSEYNFAGVFHQSKLLFSGSKEFTHDDDGSKELTIYFVFEANSGGWGPSNCIIQGVKFTLTKIDRKCKFTSIVLGFDNDRTAKLIWSTDLPFSEYRYKTHTNNNYSQWFANSSNTKTLVIGGVPRSEMMCTVQVKNTQSGLITTSSTIKGTFPFTASTMTLSHTSRNIGDQLTFEVTKKRTEYSHTIEWVIGSKSDYIVGTPSNPVTSTNHTISVPSDVAYEIKNSSSATMYFRIKTYFLDIDPAVAPNYAMTVVIPNTNQFKPTITVNSIKEGNTSTSMSIFSGYVQSKSMLNIDVSTTMKYGTTLDSIKMELDGVTYSDKHKLVTNILNYEGTKNLVITAKDRRGYYSVLNVPITVHKYYPPKLTGVVVRRHPTDQDTNLSAYIKFDVAPVNNWNNKSYSIKYRVKGTSSWTTLVSNDEYYSRETTHVGTNVLHADNSYEVEYRVNDQFTSASTIVQIGSAFTLIDFLSSGRGIAFGKVSTRSGLDFGMEAYDRWGNEITGDGIYRYFNFNGTGTSLTDWLTFSFELDDDSIIFIQMDFASHTILGSICISGYTYQTGGVWYQPLVVGNTTHTLEFRFTSMGVNKQRFLCIRPTSGSWGEWFRVKARLWGHSKYSPKYSKVRLRTFPVVQGPRKGMITKTLTGSMG